MAGTVDSHKQSEQI